MGRTASLPFFVMMLVATLPLGATARPPEDKELGKKIEALIDKLTEVTNPDLGYCPTASGTIFLPLDSKGQFGAVLLAGPTTQQPLAHSETLQELEKLGAAAVPHLISHLDDRRPTRINAISHAGFIGGLWFEDACDYNARTQKPLAARKAALPDMNKNATSHQLAVGDLCYVALGQIVNRAFIAARYQPTAIIIVASPIQSETLRAAVKEHWGGLTPEKHKASLLADLANPDSEYRRIGAAKRLAYFYPEALEEPALKLLARPTYDASDVWQFVRKKLYAAKNPKDRKVLLDGYLSGKTGPYREGVLVQLFEDLESLEANEEGRRSPPLKEFSDQPRVCLVELFGKPKDVKSKDVPANPDLLTNTGKGRFIEEGLVYDRSSKLDRAVRDLLVSLQDDDTLAAACMARIVGRGFDADFEKYCATRPDNAELKDALSRVGWTPLHVAIWREDVEAVTELLRKGADAGAASKRGQTPLHMAASLGDVALARQLLDAKAPPDPKDKEGSTPIVTAFRGDHFDFVQLLTDRGAVVPDVLIAAVVGRADLAKRFLSDDPSRTEAKNEQEQTALHLAALRGHAAVVEVLLAVKATVDPLDKQFATPLHLACIKGHLQVVRVLVTGKADVRKTLGDGGPEPLHLAAFHGHPKIADFLLGKGAALQVKVGMNGATALHLAAFQGYAELVELLIDRGAVLEETELQGKTPLHLAATVGHTRVAELLIKRKASLNAKTKDEGKTPLHLAAEGGHRDTVALLLSHKADAEAKDVYDQTPRDLAETTGNKEILKLIEEAAKRK